MDFESGYATTMAGAGDLLSPDPPPSETAPQADSIASLVAEVLEATGLVPAERLRQARSRASGGSLAQAIVDEGIVLPEQVARALAARHHHPFVDLQGEGVETEAAASIPAHVLERALAVPYRIEGGRLKVAIADPTNVQAIDELRLATRYPVDIAVAPRADVELELRQFARASGTWERRALLEDEVEVQEESAELDTGDVSDAPLVRLVNSVILQAAEDGASDLHFDPQDDGLVVRLRIDGVLQEVQRIPKRLAGGVAARIKVLANLDIAERRKPQDGRISLNAKTAGRLLDIRVAVLPTVEGESVVMRLLDKSQRTPTVSDLGLVDEMRAKLEDVVRKPTGALLVTGPTGSGKSTTLYAALAELSRPEINVITVEDPVEYRLAGLNQVQVNPKAGLTFASALRSILRADPDVLMVGEIRDVETAKMTIEAALTGHFVLSTLHTNDAPAALARLNEMGVEPFLTGSAVTAVLAQRLVRKLCTDCRELYVPTEEEALAAGFRPGDLVSSEGMALYRKRGCPRCSSTGYKGRIGVFQLMTMSEELERLAAQRASREELERAAIRGGMKTLWDDGLAKVTSGLTSVDELRRVLV